MDFGWIDTISSRYVLVSGLLGSNKTAISVNVKSTGTGTNFWVVQSEMEVGLDPTENICVEEIPLSCRLDWLLLEPSQFALAFAN